MFTKEELDLINKVYENDNSIINKKFNITEDAAIAVCKLRNIKISETDEEGYTHYTEEFIGIAEKIGVLLFEDPYIMED